jgi:hypothetical protein
MIDSVRLNSLEQKRFGLTASPLCSNRTSQRGLAHRDSLRAKIDEGLSHSRFGAVILSEALFAKHWPQRELNALVALESNTRKVLLPILHGINQQQVARYSPILTDKLSTSTHRGIQHVAMEIANAIRQSRQTTRDESLGNQ